MYSFARAAITKYDRLGGSNITNLFCQPWRLEFRDQGIGRDGFFLKFLSLPWRWPPSAVSSRAPPSLHICVLRSSSYEDTSHSKLGPTLMTSFKLSYFFKDPVYKYGHILRYQRVGFQHINCGEGQNSAHHKRLLSAQHSNICFMIRDPVVPFICIFPTALGTLTCSGVNESHPWNSKTHMEVVGG